MKKIMLSLCALMLGFFVVSCGGNSSKSGDDEKDDKEKVENADGKDSKKADKAEKKSATKDYVAAANKLMDEVSESWSASDWESFMQRYADLTLEFYASNPSESEFKAFDKIEPPVEGFSEDAQRAAMEGVMAFTQNNASVFQEIQQKERELKNSFK